MKENGAVAPFSQNSDKKLSPINRPYRVGWGVQPKMPIYIFKIERRGGVPLSFLYSMTMAHNTRLGINVCSFLVCVIFKDIKIPPSFIPFLKFLFRCIIQIQY